VLKADGRKSDLFPFDLKSLFLYDRKSNIFRVKCQFRMHK
jgi:hypothetical protein